MRRGQCYHRERVKLFNAFADFGLSDMNRSEAFTYIILYRDTQETGLARTSRTEIARRGGMTERQASRALKSLVDRGVIHRVCRGYPGKIAVYSVFQPEELIRINPSVKKLLEWKGQKTMDTNVTNTHDKNIQNP